MYVTRPLSQILKSPETVVASLEGPNSGYLVIQDEESETYCCFGLCKNRTLQQLPFPQNMELTVQYVMSNGQSSYASLDPVFLIPVLNQPLFSNRYYAIVPHGSHKGEAYTCSKEEDKTTCCFCRCVKDVKPKPLDPHDIHQQFKIVPYEGICTSRGQFFATSAASDGFPPYFLRRKGWTINTKTPDGFKLDDTARGVDASLRGRLPELGQSHVVGKWYTPYIFVKDGSVKDQVKRCLYYEVTLEQRWEKIFSCQKDSSSNGSVVVDTWVENEEVLIGGNKATWNERGEVDGVIWFVIGGGQMGRVGLRVELVERMKWEEEREGWRGGGEGRRVKINRVEEWSEERSENMGCYVLVERFNFKRMDGSVVITYDFKHTHRINTK